MTDQAGFKVGPHFFPLVQEYKHGDPILIREVTGLEWNEFAEMLADVAPGSPTNPIVETALLAVSVQHAQPTWSRKRVNDFVRNLNLGAEEIIGTESDKPAEGDPDANPEEVARTTVPPSDTSASSSNSDAESSTPEESSRESSATPSPNGSADPGSSTSTPVSLQVA